MPGHVSVDVRQLRYLSTQYRVEADELRNQIARFHQQTASTSGAYGDTANAEHAERAHRDAIVQVQDELARMHRELVETADHLDELARHFTGVMTDADGVAARPTGAR